MFVGVCVYVCPRAEQHESLRHRHTFKERRNT